MEVAFARGEVVRRRAGGLRERRKGRLWLCIGLLAGHCWPCDTRRASLTVLDCHLVKLLRPNELVVSRDTRDVFAFPGGRSEQKMCGFLGVIILKVIILGWELRRTRFFQKIFNF